MVSFFLMRLTQIKLSGFKSFVDPTSIHLPGKLVGVVGPNGCGKSNVIDAVRWVLGESRAAALRGDSMQDVIFNGSANRKPLARASVELIFDNDSLSDDKPKGGGTRRFEGRITRLEPLRALAHTWGWDGKETEVLYELSAKGKDVLLTIQHRLPEGGGMIKGGGAGWAVHVGILADRLNGAKPRPFWTTHDKLMKEFEAAA